MSSESEDIVSDTLPHSSSWQQHDHEEARGHSLSIAEMNSGDTISMDSLPVRSVDYPPGFQGKSRRSSVSAESDRPPAGTVPFVKKVIEKTASAMDRIRRATAKSILFIGLDEQQKQDVWNSMEEMKVEQGDVIITQFQEGDYFYVIDAGQFNVYKRSSPSAVSSENDGYGPQVFQYETGGSFGELALMYNTPRAATVRAETSGILWRTDRETFRHIIIDSTANKRKSFEAFLESIPLLANLSRQERAQVADCLETVTFKEGDIIIKQGEDGDKLFLILEGLAKATQFVSGSSAADAVEVGRMGPSNYFGEKSLLTRQPRAANVIAISDMTCACMDRSGFERLLGPLKDIMKTHAAKYAKAEDIIKAKSASNTTSPTNASSSKQ